MNNLAWINSKDKFLEVEFLDEWVCVSTPFYITKLVLSSAPSCISNHIKCKWCKK